MERFEHVCKHSECLVTCAAGNGFNVFKSLCFSPCSDETFELGLSFELVLEVRPRMASGVLLHVRRAEGYFIVYIHQGAVSPQTRGSQDPSEGH